MARRERARDQDFKYALEKVTTLLGTPLDQVGLKLRDFLVQAQQSFQGDQLGLDAFSTLCARVAEIVERLPRSFGERFYFDSALIRGIGEEWGRKLKLSRMIIPIHGGMWGHTRVPMPSEDMISAHVVDLIHMPGRDQLQDVNLLDYPWIIHELGHYVLLQYDSSFIPLFRQELDQTIARLRLASIADRGSARVKAQNRVDELAKFWSPTHDQKNWAHELTIDMLSLLSCGPAYLASFCDVVEKPDLNPYEVTEMHPPYAVRADALVTTATQIGLADFTESLRRLCDNWRTGPWKSRRDNRFLCLASPELMESCRKLAFSLCDSLQLRKCTRERLNEITCLQERESLDEIGLDLLLLAWSVYEAKGEQAYLDWKLKVLDRLVKKVTQ